MSENFILNFEYQNRPYAADCFLRTSAFNYQFVCLLEGVEIIAEKDDEGKLRARLGDPLMAKKPDPGLIRAMMEEMERILL